MTAAEDGSPTQDAPQPGCDPNCLCCRGGKATVWRTSAEDWYAQPCGICGGYPEREPIERILLGDRLADLKAACKAYKAQLQLDDPFRTFTLKRAQGILADMLDLEAGRGIREAVAPPVPLDAEDQKGRE